MKETKIERMSRLLGRLSDMGFSYSEAQSLRRIEMTLHRWGEHECNGDIERDEETGKTYSVSRAYTQGTGEYKRWPTTDRETGALNRLAKIMAKHPGLWSYHQSDPRGCALYVGRDSEIPALTRKEWLATNPTDKSGEAFSAAQRSQIHRFYSRGVAVCI